MIKIRSPQDLGAAALFACMGLAGLFLGSRLGGIRPDGQLGTGTMPYILSWICIGFGGLMLLRALRLDGPAVARIPWRAVAMVTLSLVAFGFLVELAGYLATAILTPLIAILALPDFRRKEAVIVSLALGIGTTLLFVVLLGQPLQPWPGVR